MADIKIINGIFNENFFLMKIFCMGNFFFMGVRVVWGKGKGNW